MSHRLTSILCHLVGAAGMIAAFIYLLRGQDKARGVLALIIAIIVARILVLDIAMRGASERESSE